VLGVQPRIDFILLSLLLVQVRFILEPFEDLAIN